MSAVLVPPISHYSMHVKKVPWDQLWFSPFGMYGLGIMPCCAFHIKCSTVRMSRNRWIQQKAGHLTETANPLGGMWGDGKTSLLDTVIAIRKHNNKRGDLPLQVLKKITPVRNSFFMATVTSIFHFIVHDSFTLGGVVYVILHLRVIPCLKTWLKTIPSLHLKHWGFSF